MKKDEEKLLKWWGKNPIKATSRIIQSSLSLASLVFTGEHEILSSSVIGEWRRMLLRVIENRLCSFSIDKRFSRTKKNSFSNIQPSHLNFQSIFFLYHYVLGVFNTNLIYFRKKSFLLVFVKAKRRAENVESFSFYFSSVFDLCKRLSYRHIFAILNLCTFMMWTTGYLWFKENKNYVNIISERREWRHSRKFSGRILGSCEKETFSLFMTITFSV